MAKIRGWRKINTKKWQQGSWHTVEVIGKRGKPPHKSSGRWRYVAKVNGRIVERGRVRAVMIEARDDAIEYMKKRSI